MTLPSGQNALTDPYAERGPIRTPMLVLIFAITVPAFFLFGMLSLWLVETEVWLVGHGRVTAEQTYGVYVKQRGTIAELGNETTATDNETDRAARKGPLGGGAVFAAGATILRMDDSDVQQHVVDLTAGAADSTARINTLNTQISLAEQSGERESAARKLALYRARHEAEQVHLAGLQERLRIARQRLSERIHRMPFDGQLVWAGDWQPGQWVEAGTLVATAHALGSRRLTITVDEDIFAQVEVGTAVRFTSSVVSVYQYDYYWGDVIERRVVQGGDDEYRYELTATLEPGDNALPMEQLPLGSTGQVDIASEHKSLLAQMVGW